MPDDSYLNYIKNLMPDRTQVKNVVTDKRFIIVSATAVCSFGTFYIVPFAAWAVGFSYPGVVKGSLAASAVSKFCGGYTASGSVIAMAQSIGATGSLLASSVATKVSMCSGAAFGYVTSTRMLSYFSTKKKDD